jgi:hypothetical protein
LTHSEVTGPCQRKIELSGSLQIRNVGLTTQPRHDLRFSSGVFPPERGNRLYNRQVSLSLTSVLATHHLVWDFPAAGRDLQSALRLDPVDAEVYLAAATFWSALGEKDAAVLAAKRAVDLDPASSLLKSDLFFFWSPPAASRPPRPKESATATPTC